MAWVCRFLLSTVLRIFDSEPNALFKQDSFKGIRMTRTTFLSSAVFAVLLGTPAAAATSPLAVAGAQATHQATATGTARFLGDWILAMQGPNGPATFNLSVTVENEKTVGEISSETMPKQAITDVAIDKESLVLSYSFDYQGNAVDAAGDVDARDRRQDGGQISFAGRSERDDWFRNEEGRAKEGAGAYAPYRVWTQERFREHWRRRSGWRRNRN